MPAPVTRPRTPAPGSSRYSAQSCRTALLVRRRPKSGVMPRETHTFSAHVDLGTLTRVDPGQFGAVGGRDRRADRTVALSYTGVVTQTACWEERSQVCDEIRLALAEVRRRTPSAVPSWGPRGTTPRLTVRGTTAGAPPPPPPPHCLGAVGSGPPAIHCPTAWGQWAVDLLQYTAPLLGAVGSATPAIHCLTAWGQWAVQLLQCTASLPWGQWAVELLQYTASLPWGQWAVDPLQCTAPMPGGSGQWTSCNTLPHCLGAVGSGTPAIHCLTAWGQWAVDLLHYTAPVPWGSGQLTSCITLPHCLGAAGSGPPSTHCPTA